MHQSAHVVRLVIMRQTRRVEPGSRDDAGTEVVDDVSKVVVAAGLGDTQVELEVRRHRISGMGSTLVEFVQRRTHACQLFIATPLRRKACRLDLQSDAQLQYRQHLTQRDHGGRVDAKAPRGRRVQHKGANAMAGLDLAGGLQPRDRLTHHGTAHALLGHDLRFGRQLVAALELAAANTLGQHRDQFLGQTARLAPGLCLYLLLCHALCFTLKDSRHHSASSCTITYTRRGIYHRNAAGIERCLK
ncbi:hypothetical protein D3C78_470270 [compost metagenome]